MTPREVQSQIVRAIEQEYEGCLKRHQGDGIDPERAHALALSQATAMLQTALVSLGRDLLLAEHGWEPVDMQFPTEEEHERYRPKPQGCRHCRGSKFWTHPNGGPRLCAICHPDPRELRRVRQRLELERQAAGQRADLACSVIGHA